jgi:hypothetical protein
MAVEWTITIEGRNEFGDVWRKAVRIDKRWERPSDGDLGLSIEDGKTIMTALQSAVVNHEAETYSFRRVCPDCHRFRPVKDYKTRQIRTVFGTVEVRNPRWMMCRDCYPGMVVAFAPLKEIRSSDIRADGTVGAAGEHDAVRRAADVLAEFLPVELTETHATVRKRTIRIGERLDDQVAEEELCARAQTGERQQLECSFQAIAAKSSSSASIRRISAAPIPIQRATSSSLWPDAAAAGGAKAGVAIS